MRPLPSFLIALLAVSAPGWSQLPNPGVYCATPAGLLQLSQLPLPGVRTLSWGEWLASDNRFAMHYTWDGATSHAQISEHRPTFRVNLAYQPDRSLRIVQIVKLEQKDSYRKTQLRIGHDVPTQFRAGVAVSLTRGMDGEILVQPDADLSPGEYLLSLGPLVSQYDFSVR